MKDKAKRKDFFRHNVPAASIALILIVLFSTMFGINRSVGKLADKVKDAYNDNDKTYGCAYTQVLDFIDCAEKMTDVMDNAGGDTGRLFEEKLDDLKKHKNSPFGLYERMNEVLSLVERNDQNFTQEFSYLRGMNADIKMLHNNEAYNEAAIGFNQATDTLLGKLYFGKKDAAVF